MTLDYAAIAKLLKAGVPIAFSGEYSNMFGAREDMLWNGLEMMRILHDGKKVLPLLTSVPARMLCLENVTGAVREGLSADLAVWSDDPLVTYQAKVLTTYQAGEVIYREGDALKCM